MITDVNFAVPEADFLSHFDLDVSVRDRRLKDDVRSLDVLGLQSNLTSFGICAFWPVSTHDKLRVEYPKLTKSRNHEQPVKHKVMHHTTTGPPVAARGLEVARHEFERMFRLGVIRPSSSNRSSPLHLVPKQDSGHWRPCGDYRALDAVTTPDQLPVPRIHDYGARLTGTKLCSRWIW